MAHLRGLKFVAGSAAGQAVRGSVAERSLAGSTKVLGMFIGPAQRLVVVDARHIESHMESSPGLRPAFEGPGPGTGPGPVPAQRTVGRERPVPGLSRLRERLAATGALALCSSRARHQEHIPAVHSALQPALSARTPEVDAELILIPIEDLYGPCRLTLQAQSSLKPNLKPNLNPFSSDHHARLSSANPS